MVGILVPAPDWGIWEKKPCWYAQCFLRGVSFEIVCESWTCKNNCRIKIAKQVKLWTAILCKTIQDQKKAQKDELKNAQDISS